MVGVVFALLYGAGAYDYVMTHRHDRAYFSAQGYGQAQITYFTDYPILPAVFWTVAVWGALAAALLLLLRTRWATAILLVALVSQLCLVVVTFGFMDRWQILGPWLALFDLGVLAATCGLLLYCRAMSARGVLR